MQLEVPVVNTTSVDDLDDIDILFLEPHETDYPDDKLFIDCPKSANKAISSVDWELTHRDFDHERELQEVDISATDLVIDALRRGGFTIGITPPVANRLRSNPNFETS